MIAICSGVVLSTEVFIVLNRCERERIDERIGEKWQEKKNENEKEKEMEWEKE